jgi:hypothetical protein
MPSKSFVLPLGSASEYASPPGQTSEKLNCAKVVMFSLTVKSRLMRRRLESWSPTPALGLVDVGV